MVFESELGGGLCNRSGTGEGSEGVLMAVHSQTEAGLSPDHLAESSRLQ